MNIVRCSQLANKHIVPRSWILNPIIIVPNSVHYDRLKSQVQDDHRVWTYTRLWGGNKRSHKYGPNTLQVSKDQTEAEKCGQRKNGNGKIIK